MTRSSITLSICFIQFSTVLSLRHKTSNDVNTSTLRNCLQWVGFEPVTLGDKQTVSQILSAPLSIFYIFSLKQLYDGS